MTAHATEVIRDDFVVQPLKATVFVQFNAALLDLFANLLDTSKLHDLIGITILDENISRIRTEKRFLNLTKTLPKLADVVLLL